MQDFEPTYHQFENRPVEAIKHLMQVQKGQAIKALYRSDIGFIDIVWGDDTMGLCHIINKHGREFNQAGVNIWDVLPIIIKFGKVDKYRSSKKHLVVNHDFFRGVIKLNFDEKEKRFLITAFDTLFPDRSPAFSGIKKNMLVHSSAKNLLFPDRNPAVSGFAVRAADPLTNNSGKDNILM